MSIDQTNLFEKFDSPKSVPYFQAQGTQENIDQVDKSLAIARPLAHELRPQKLSDFLGFPALKKRYGFLAQSRLPSMILFGPPGCGKTTLAKLLADGINAEITHFNAVLAGVPELKKIIARIIEVQKQSGKKEVLFIDEIHRFNKGQQDALLPYVERGDFILIGATTEYPRAALTPALLSRCQLVALPAITSHDLNLMLASSLSKLKNLPHYKEVLDKHSTMITNQWQSFIAEASGGDGRRALSALEIVIEALRELGDKESLSPEQKLGLEQNILESARRFDKAGDRHYDVISAFIKSMRGSDPDAALVWLAVMLEGGEDPAFIARRLVIFASEDVGNADPSALTLAVAALQTVEKIGMPEARITLAQATTYLASTVKSNASYRAIDMAISYVKDHPTLSVPEHLKNHPAPKSAPYLYPHNYPAHFIEQKYGPVLEGKELEGWRFYQPTEQGRDKALRERLKSLWPFKNWH